MLISLSEVLETPVSTLLGENIVVPEADQLKEISAKLEVINLQLAQAKTIRRKIIHWSLIVLCAAIIVTFVVLYFWEALIWHGIMETLKPPSWGWQFIHWNGCMSE